MIGLYLLGIPENAEFLRVAEKQDSIRIRPVGPYFELTSDKPIVIDRRSTGMRHAVWYSCIAGTAGCTITQWDRDALRAEHS